MTTTPKMRFYIHGDQDEADAGRYYCAECDVFFSESHFADEHRMNHFARYDDAAKNVTKVLKGSRQYFRPASPPNLFV